MLIQRNTDMIIIEQGAPGSIPIREFQLGDTGPQLFTKGPQFCKFDVVAIGAPDSIPFRGFQLDDTAPHFFPKGPQVCKFDMVACCMCKLVEIGNGRQDILHTIRKG